MSLCLFQETNRREKGSRHSERKESSENLKKKKKKQKAEKMKGRASERAVAYFCESEHMNMEELNSSE